MQRTFLLAAAAAATLFTATAANASRVNWSVDINLPPVATVISSGPGYYPASAYYGEPVYSAPTYYPAPSYYRAPTYYPAPAYYPPRVGFAPRHRIWLPPPPPLPRFPVPWRDHDYRDGGHDQQHHDGRVDWRR